MSRKKFRNLSVVFFVGLFVLSFEPVFLWFLVGAVVLLNPEEGRGKSEKPKNYIFQIGADARKFGVKMPRPQSLRNLLVQVYQNFETSKREYPHLKAECRSVIDEMWSNLASDARPEHWNIVISSVLAGWPKQNQKHSVAVQRKLDELSELSRQWDDAKREALGGAHV